MIPSAPTQESVKQSLGVVSICCCYLIIHALELEFMLKKNQPFSLYAVQIELNKGHVFWSPDGTVFVKSV